MRTYTQLAQWHADLGDSINILLYPSGEFGGQEFDDVADIREFVSGKFNLPLDGGGVVLMEKGFVNDPELAAPEWKLAKEAFPGEIGWNFAGVFTFDKEGIPTGRFDSRQLAAAGAALTADL